MVLGRNGHNRGPDSLENDEDVGREVVVGVLQHQVAGQRSHVTHARISDLKIEASFARAISVADFFAFLLRKLICEFIEKIWGKYHHRFIGKVTQLLQYFYTLFNCLE